MHKPVEKCTSTAHTGGNRKVILHFRRTQLVPPPLHFRFILFCFSLHSFPSPCVIVKGRQTSDLSVRKLFQSPVKFQLSPVKKTVRFNNFFKSLHFSSDYSPDSDTSPLARMMVSPFDDCTSPSSPSSTGSGVWK